jgi:hypothetical protein
VVPVFAHDGMAKERDDHADDSYGQGGIQNYDECHFRALSRAFELGVSKHRRGIKDGRWETV